MNTRQARLKLEKICHLKEAVLMPFIVYDDITETSNRQLPVECISCPVVVPVCMKYMHHSHMGVVVLLPDSRCFVYSVPDDVWACIARNYEAHRLPCVEQENDCCVKCLQVTEYILTTWNKSTK